MSAVIEDAYGARVGTVRLRLQARDLRPGDICIGSGALVTRGPTLTAGGKVALQVKYPEQRPMWFAWRRYTEINVLRKETK